MKVQIIEFKRERWREDNDYSDAQIVITQKEDLTDFQKLELCRYLIDSFSSEKWFKDILGKYGYSKEKKDQSKISPN